MDCWINNTATRREYGHLSGSVTRGEKSLRLVQLREVKYLCHWFSYAMWNIFAIGSVREVKYLCHWFSYARWNIFAAWFSYARCKIFAIGSVTRGAKSENSFRLVNLCKMECVCDWLIIEVEIFLLLVYLHDIELFVISSLP